MWRRELALAIHTCLPNIHVNFSHVYTGQWAASLVFILKNVSFIRSNGTNPKSILVIEHRFESFISYKYVTQTLLK